MTSKKDIATMESIVGSMALQELLALREGLNSRIDEIQNEQKEKFLNDMRLKWQEMRQQALDFGLSPEEAIGIMPPAKRTATRTTGNSGERSNVKAKYINPDNPSETYSGRGRRANWLTRELARMGLDENAEIPIKFHAR